MTLPETALSLGRRTQSRVTALDPRVVVGGFVLAQWALVLGLAHAVRHNGWIYYQGGDQLWYHTSGWLFAHGSLTEPLVGYLWAVVLAPIALVQGPNLADSLPAILVLDVVVLLPVALLALYGIACRIAGRLFAYWVLALWLLVPLVGVELTEPGYHQRYTEILLPQGFGLTAMADFPTLVAVLVAAYFCARVVFDDDSRLLDGLAAGVATGAAVGLKPSAALFLAGPPLALLVARRWRGASAFVVGTLPAVVTLSVWKWRGYGYLPLLHALPMRAEPLAAGRGTAAVTIPYWHFNWQHFTQQLDLLREHFWSGRLIEWLVVAGAIGTALFSWRLFVFVVGWFFASALIKAGNGGINGTSIEDTNLLRVLIPTYPAFLLMIASLPFLVPGFAKRAAAARLRTSARGLSARAFSIGIGVAVVATALVPLAVIATASPVGGTDPRAAAVQQPPVPTGVDVDLRATRSAKGIELVWTRQRSIGGGLFYHVFRTPAGEPAFSCPGTIPVPECVLAATDLGTTRAPAFVDTHAAGGRFAYRIGVAANWLDDPQYGDVYELSKPVTP